jgi:hypothetical protein
VVVIIVILSEAKDLIRLDAPVAWSEDAILLALSRLRMTACGPTPP